MPGLSSRSKRAKPGSRGGGRFFHVEVRPAGDFVLSRSGRRRSRRRRACAGRRASGSWDTAKWLIEKTDAHVEDGHLIADSVEAEKLFASLGSPPRHVEGDRFQAVPRRDIPESEKPTSAMLANIRTAQAAVRLRTKGKP
jgi:hypothetical protein